MSLWVGMVGGPTAYSVLNISGTIAVSTKVPAPQLQKLVSIVSIRAFRDIMYHNIETNDCIVLHEYEKLFLSMLANFGVAHEWAERSSNSFLRSQCEYYVAAVGFRRY